MEPPLDEVVAAQVSMREVDGAGGAYESGFVTEASATEIIGKKSSITYLKCLVKLVENSSH